MNTRTIKRQIAKNRAKIVGIERINRGFSNRDESNIPNWKKFLSGKTGEKAAEAQALEGVKSRRKAETDKRIKARRLRKV